MSLFLLLSLCIQLVFVVKPTSRTCSANEFACLDGSRCVKESWLCNGYTSCDDRSDEFASQCNNCTSSNLLRCHKGGKDICIVDKHKCDGKVVCDDVADELLSECGNCSSSLKFACKYLGSEACLLKAKYQCNGKLDSCSDGSDETPSVCANCTLPGLHMCRDGSRCVKTKYLCKGEVNPL